MLCSSVCVKRVQCHKVLFRGVKQVTFRKEKKIMRIQRRLKVHAKKERASRTWRIGRGDTVFVLGVRPEDGEQIGQVLLVDRLRERALVSGVNEKAQTILDETTGENNVVTKPDYVHYDSLRLLDPVDGQPTSSRYFFQENGEKARKSTRSGEIITLPVYTPMTHKTHEKDTPRDQVMKVTYKPTDK